MIDVAARYINAPAIDVPARFDGNAIISGTERAIRDQYVFAALGIAAIVIWAMAIDFHVPHGHVLAKNRVQLPHGRVDHREVFEENVLAAVRLNEVRPQIVPWAENPFPHGHIVIAHVDESLSVIFGATFAVPRAAAFSA